MNNLINTPWIKTIARTGLTAKGAVYLILGSLAFMAAFEIGGQSNTETNRNGIFSFVREMPAGVPLLLVLIAGLVCYSIWRGVQTFTIDEEDEKKKWGKRLRYTVSGLTYLSLAFTALQFLLHRNKDHGDQNQHWAEKIMHQPFGQWLLGIGALVLAGVGVYQIVYGLSEKYKKHVQQQSTHSRTVSTLLLAGKIGYVARGIVWLLLSYLLLRAAIDANPKEAGDTGKAFEFIEGWSAGSYLLGALGAGLAAYGIFNFVRARFETFK